MGRQRNQPAGRLRGRRVTGSSRRHTGTPGQTGRPRPPGTSGPESGPPTLERVDEIRWRLPRAQRDDMRVDGLVFASAELMAELRDDPSLGQVANVATLPGIVGHSLAMPDVHWGYGFPIGGVAATRADGGVISPGGIGFDINCGVRLYRSDLAAADLHARRERLADALFHAVPSGVGASSGGHLDDEELERILVQGSERVVDLGLGWPEDLERTEEGGRLQDAKPAAVSRRARQRGAGQLGTLGSGNHFLEVDTVDAVYDAAAARVFGLAQDQVVVFIHCGSRGLGHQVCTDHVAVMDAAMSRYGIHVPDRQLACVPLDSREGRAYLGAMAAAANFAWANRQTIGHNVRQAFAGILGVSDRALGMDLVYDLSHNIAKFERHIVEGRKIEVCVHRKGATRAFPAGRPEVPAIYRDVGQPVFIPGDMGRHSMVAVGAPAAMEETFGSTCHGAGRRLSRHQALRELRGIDIAGQLRGEDIIVRAERPGLLGEEASLAYKDVSAVVRVAEAAGHVRAVVRLRPLIVVKG